MPPGGTPNPCRDGAPGPMSADSRSTPHAIPGFDPGFGPLWGYAIPSTQHACHAPQEGPDLPNAFSNFKFSSAIPRKLPKDSRWFRAASAPLPGTQWIRNVGLHEPTALQLRNSERAIASGFTRHRGTRFSGSTPGVKPDALEAPELPPHARPTPPSGHRPSHAARVLVPDPVREWDGPVVPETVPDPHARRSPPAATCVWEWFPKKPPPRRTFRGRCRRPDRSG